MAFQVQEIGRLFEIINAAQGAVLLISGYGDQIRKSFKSCPAQLCFGDGLGHTAPTSPGLPDHLPDNLYLAGRGARLPWSHQRLPAATLLISARIDTGLLQHLGKLVQLALTLFSCSARSCSTDSAMLCYIPDRTFLSLLAVAQTAVHGWQHASCEMFSRTFRNSFITSSQNYFCMSQGLHILRIAWPCYNKYIMFYGVRMMVDTLWTLFTAVNSHIALIGKRHRLLFPVGLILPFFCHRIKLEG